MASISGVIDQLRSIPEPTAPFTGQTIVVTGSNRGLGFEAAKHFVRLEAKRVILAVRSLSSGEAAKVAIESATRRNDVVEVWQLDMLDYQSIKDFSARCDSLDRLDVLVANAGLLRNTYEESEGTEVTIKVNVIGTFLLAINLLPAMRRSGQKTGQTARMVVTSSVMHEEVCRPSNMFTGIAYNLAKFAERHEPRIFDAFNRDSKAAMGDRYNTSKLLEILLIRSITEAMQEGPHAAEPVIWNSVNPGLCHSDLDDKVTGIAGKVLTVAKALMARTTEVGSRTLVHSAAAGQESHGKYMSECKVKAPGAFVRSKEGEEAGRRVHSELLEILENIQPGVTKNI